MTQDEQKRLVAREAVKFIVEDAYLGVGTGTTANYFIDELAKVKNRIKGAVASSIHTADRLKGYGIPVIELTSVDELPVYVDGAKVATLDGPGTTFAFEQAAPASLHLARPVGGGSYQVTVRPTGPVDHTSYALDGSALLLATRLVDAPAEFHASHRGAPTNGGFFVPQSAGERFLDDLATRVVDLGPVEEDDLAPVPRREGAPVVAICAALEDQIADRADREWPHLAGCALAFDLDDIFPLVTWRAFLADVDCAEVIDEVLAPDDFAGGRIECRDHTGHPD